MLKGHIFNKWPESATLRRAAAEHAIRSLHHHPVRFRSKKFPFQFQFRMPQVVSKRAPLPLGRHFHSGEEDNVLQIQHMKRGEVVSSKLLPSSSQERPPWFQSGGAASRGGMARQESTDEGVLEDHVAV